MMSILNHSQVWEFEAKPLTSGTKTFANNLCTLMKTSGIKITHICDELHISRTQLSRYMNGLSYPKPHTIVEIGRVFGVDARILTHRLIPAANKITGGYSNFANALSDGGFFINSPNKKLDFMTPDQNTLEEGLYYCWQTSVAFPGRTYKSLVQVKTVRGLKVLEARDLSGGCPDDIQHTTGLRKEMGICFQLEGGFSVLSFVAGSDLNYYSSFQRQSWLHSNRFLGVGFWTTSGDCSNRSLQAIAMEKAPNKFGAIKRFARETGFCEESDLPDFSRRHFRAYASDNAA